MPICLLRMMHAPQKSKLMNDVSLHRHRLRDLAIELNLIRLAYSCDTFTAA